MPRILSLLTGLGLAFHDALDLAESCIDDLAWRAPGYRSNGIAFKKWVFAYVVNASAKIRKVHSRLIQLPEGFDTPGPIPLSAKEFDVAEPHIAAVREAVAGLSKDEQAIIGLIEDGDREGERETAKSSSIAPQAVRVRRHRLLRRLKDKLEHDPRILDFIAKRESGGYRPKSIYRG